MIVFRQLKCRSVENKNDTGPSGVIDDIPSVEYAMTHLGHQTDESYKLCGTIINLETMQVYIQQSSYDKLPDWVHDPLIRQLKVEQYKQKQKESKNGNSNNNSTNNNYGGGSSD